jgi:hypothetical protein
VHFEIVSDIADVEAIASGKGVTVRRHLERTYGKGRWRKMKGMAMVQLADGTVHRAEVHWYEAHGIGRKEYKLKRLLR